MKSQRRRRVSSSRKSAAVRRLSLESLEERSLLATFHVSLTGDDTTGTGTIAAPFRSIPKALAVAEVTAGPNAIKVASGTYNQTGVDKGFGISSDADLANLDLEGGWDATFTTQTLGGTVYLPQTNSNGGANNNFDPDINIFNSATVRGFTFVFDGQVGPGGTTQSGGLRFASSGTIITQNTIEIGFSTANPRSAGIVTGTPSVGDLSGSQITNNVLLANGGASFNFVNNSTGIFLSPDNPGRATNILVTGNSISGPNLGVGIAIDRLSNVVVDGNTIQRTGATSVGLPYIDLRQANAGTGPYATPQSGIVITNNTLDGSGLTVVGIDLSARATPTQQVTGVTITNNFLQNFGGSSVGLFTNQATVQGSGVNFNANSVPGSFLAVSFGGTGTLNASNNWWGTTSLAAITPRISGSVDYTPFLNLGTDTSASTGFQPDFSDLTVHTAGGQTGATTRINEGIASVTSGGTVRVLAGTYAENVVVNKAVILVGAQAGVDARGRVSGSPNPAVETIIAPASGIAIELQDPADNTTINGFAVVGSLNGATGAITSTTGPTDNLKLLNNYVAVATGFTASTLFLNRSAIDADIDRNEFLSPAGASQALLFDGPDLFHGTHVTNNNILHTGASGGTGLFIDGNHNWSISTSLRTPLLSGNLIQGFSTGANLGSRSFGSQLTPNAGTISLNTFTGNGFDGLQGGMQNALITRNTFSNNGRSGLALTSFGNIGADRGAQNTLITENFFLGNVSEDVLFSSTQLAGTIATNTLFNNSLLSTKGVTYNGTELIQASGNWWGANTNPEFTGTKISGSGAANVDYTPWLNFGTDTDLVTAGFQGDLSFLNVDDDSPQVGATGRIQEAVNLLADGSLIGASRVINVLAGTYNEDVSVTKSVRLLGAGPTAGGSTISGPIGGGGSTIQIQANDVEIAGFTITRDGNNVPQWNLALNTAGIGIQGVTGAVIHDNTLTGNRTAIDVNNSSGDTIRNNVIDFNHTGLIFRNQTDNILFTENEVTNNRTVGILFLDASGGSNSPVQTALNSTFTNNNISGNWYGQIVDRQSGSTTSRTGTNLKNFSGNWFGTTTPVITAANSTEPGYAGHIPVAYGGVAVPPGGQPDVAGPASANFDITPYLNLATDTNVETVLGRGTFGFQGDFSDLTVTAQLAQTGATPRIQEGIDSVTSDGAVTILAGSYTGAATTAGKIVTLHLGAGTSAALVSSGDVTLDGNDDIWFDLNGLAAGTQYDRLAVTGNVNLGGAVLVLDRGFDPAPGAVFQIITTTGTVSGIFAGLPNGSVVTVDGIPLTITYNANSVTLTVSQPTITWANDTWIATDDASGGGPGIQVGDTVMSDTSMGDALVTGKTFGYNAFSTVQGAINAVTNPGTVYVLTGNYPENVVVNKSLTILGAQAGVDARGRVVGSPSTTVESVIAPASGIAIELQDPADNTTIDGLAIVASVNGANGAITSTTGATDNLDLLNNYVAVATGFTASTLFLNRSAIDADIDRNEFISPFGTSQALFFDGPDLFHGMHVTNNNILHTGAAGGTGLFIDGNHNWSISGSGRTPLLSGNLIQGFNTGANLGSRSFGSLATPNAGEISLNTFTGNAFDGLQGGMQNVLITRNTFSNNGRSGLALTSFGNMGADRGAQNTLITENFFFGNAVEDVLFSATQAAGTIATNKLFNNSLLSARSITYNGTEIIQASGNWWGANTNPEFTGTKIGGTGAANVDYSPWLDVGTDTSATAGFQGSFAVLNVDDDSPVSGQLQEGIDLVTAGGLVNIFGGTYTGNVSATGKPVVLALGPAATTTIVTINGTFALNADDTLRFELNGLTPGTQFDQLVVNGSTSLGGANAAIDRNFIVPIGQKMTLINGQPPMTGTFAGLPNNAVSVIDGQPFTVRYGDIDGGDFTIQPAETPPVVVVGDTLLVSGTDGNDKIYLYQQGTTKLFVKINGKVYGPYNAPAITRVIVYGKNGNDYIEAQSTFKKIAELHGDNGNDTLIGSAQNDTLDGGIGNDLMKGNAGNDSMDGGDGNDSMLGGAGNDSMSGGIGNDTMKGDAGNDRIYGGDGIDKMYGGAGCDVLVGGNGGDTMYGDAGNDIVIGGRDWDKVYGGANDDIVISGTTSYDDGATNAASDAALAALSAEWCSSRTYDQRISKIMGGTLAGGARLTVGGEIATVFMDGSRDTLRGEAGRDWFFGQTGSPDYDDLDGDRVGKGPNIERKDPAATPEV